MRRQVVHELRLGSFADGQAPGRLTVITYRP